MPGGRPGEQVIKGWPRFCNMDLGGNFQVQPRLFVSRVGFEVKCRCIFFCWRMWRSCYKSVRQCMPMIQEEAKFCGDFGKF